MAYADQQGMSTNRIISIVIVVLLHAFIGYAFVTGLAFEAVNKVKERLNVVDVKEEKPPEEEPPPPEPDKQIEPPVVVPPPMVQTPPRANAVPAVPIPPVAAPLSPRPSPPAPAAPPPPPPPPPPPAGVTSGVKPKGNPGSWATTNDYPSRDLQQENQGTAGFRVTVGTDGRVTSCSITRSSGFPGLDDATCKNVSRRAKFTPAMQNGTPVESSYSNNVRWQIPKD